MVFNTNLGQSLRISSWNEPVWSATSFFSPLYQNWIFFLNEVVIPSEALRTVFLGCLAGSVREASNSWSRGCMFEPHTGCIRYLKKKKKQNSFEVPFPWGEKDIISSNIFFFFFFFGSVSHLIFGPKRGANCLGIVCLRTKDQSLS